MKKSFFIVSLLVIVLFSLVTAVVHVKADGTLIIDRPWYDKVNLKSKKSVDLNLIAGEKLFEALQKSGAEIKEGVIATDLYPDGEIYYYVEQTNTQEVVFYVRYFPGIPYEPEPDLYQATVHVLDASSNAKSGIGVTIYDANEQYPVSDTITTGSDGCAIFYLPSGDYQIHVAYPLSAPPPPLTITDAPTHVDVYVITHRKNF